MGLLSLGTPLAWSDACELSEHVRVHGIEQFLAIWRRMRDRQGDPPLWGDELEYMVVVLDPEQKTARLSLRQGEILQRLAQGRNDAASDAPLKDLPTFHPEYGRYMIESTPGRPFDMSANELLRVEHDMLLRRQLMREQLRPHEVPMTIGSFPRLGVTDTAFTDPPHTAHGAASHSLFLPDEIINTHVRFPTLTANIRKRRGSKVRINVPVFRDTHTPVPFVDPTIPWDRDLFREDCEARQGAAKADHIYMDAMGFGMGCCCLQVTFQAWSMEEARTLYDQLAPLTPLMLAVTAASPIYRGLLADVDARWNVISAAVDDRTPVERGEAPLDATAPGAHNSHTVRRRLRKSRYDSVDSYLDMNDAARACSDVSLEVNASVESRLIEAGVDHVLAAHMAHLFVRDPLVIFSENVDLDDETSVDHFENLQSTNWQTMRFKPPPPGGLIGWRIEFRPMEIQLTDFENAAFSVFIALVTRVILAQGVDWYMPISLVDENMQRAQMRDAIHTQRFHFRSPRDSSTHEYTLAELFHGTGDLPGLLPLVHRYLDTQPIAPEQRTRLNEYLDLVGARADGRLWTPATFLRRWVQRHEAYRHDSVVTDEIHYDLLATLDAIERGEKEAPELLPAGYATRRQKGI
ncbi:glutamate--cysteine ligase [Malassezia nana]|uniref:Glutamate--cysteine ligase n=1 Tax=Malassezia nana TaxID=180528 RepID=A0AAF0EIC8_9BASI|nr:glutamate--cysteine ligase [Malassezia nana]